MEVKYNNHQKTCKYCLSNLPYNKRRNDFCNQSCAAKYNNLGGCRRGKSKPLCPNCGKKIRNGLHTGLCRKCWNKHNMENMISGGKLIKSTTLRKYYVSIRGHKCEECKNTEWNEKPIPLNAHHINGNTCDNRPENVKILCPNCHAQTPNYCSKNRGNGKFKVTRVLKN